MKLLYFSSGPRERVLEALLQAGHQIETVFATDPDRWPKVAPTIQLARHAAIPVRIVHRANLSDLVPDVEGKLCLSVGFAFILPKSVIDAASIFLNVHGSLLPKYGGARTLNWVIAYGETKSGVTVHKIDEGMDTGPILCQRDFPVSIFDTGPSLARKTYEFEPSVVLDALAFLEGGKASFRRQEDVPSAQHPNRIPEHSEIDPALPLIELYDQIRAADPERYPAYFFVDGQKVCIRMWRSDKPADEFDLL